MVLGHGNNSLDTAHSYANVKIEYGFKAELLKFPPEHWMALFNSQLQTLQAEVRN